jgi:hypothetical protein
MTIPLADGTGDTGTALLARGALTHASGITNHGLQIGSACTVDPERDAAVPFQLTLTNTTSGFSAAPGISIAESSGGVAAGQLIEYAEFLDGGVPQCQAISEQYNTSGADFTIIPTTLSPGASAVFDGFFIAKSYYAPDYPNGNTVALAGSDLYIGSAGGFAPPAGLIDIAFDPAQSPHGD